MQQICNKSATYMHKYAPDMHLICRNMKEISKKYARNMYKLEYATNMPNLKYANNMQKICTLYAPDMHKYAKGICKNMQEYA